MIDVRILSLGTRSRERRRKNRRDSTFERRFPATHHRRDDACCPDAQADLARVDGAPQSCHHISRDGHGGGTRRARRRAAQRLRDERALGAPRFIALYFASLIAGSFGALLVDPLSFTVGASGAIFGLFGAATVVALASGNRDIGNRLGAIVGINLVLTFAVPVLSIGGHVGGLLGGVALAGAFVPQVRAKRPEWESIAVAMLLVAFFAAGALWAGSQWPDPLF